MQRAAVPTDLEHHGQRPDRGPRVCVYVFDEGVLQYMHSGNQSALDTNAAVLHIARGKSQLQPTGKACIHSGAGM